MRRRQQPGAPDRRGGFTLIELLVSIGVLSLIFTIVASTLAATQDSWRKSRARVEQFRDARLAFELITRTLSQATLNTYYDYGESWYTSASAGGSSGAPSRYVRESELQFLTGAAVDIFPGLPGAITHATQFYAPLGYAENPDLRPLNTLLNARGYYVQFGDDTSFRPAIINSTSAVPPRLRFRLMEFIPPTERNGVYDVNAPQKAPDTTWFQDPVFLADHSRPVADNIIALLISPRESPAAGAPPNDPATYAIAPTYSYDSTLPGSTQHLLPPLVQITIVALDEPSAIRVEAIAASGSTPPLLDPAWFAQVSDYTTDLDKLTNRLQGDDPAVSYGRLDYRVFSTTISLRTAKWGP